MKVEKARQRQKVIEMGRAGREKEKCKYERRGRRTGEKMRKENWSK